MRQSNQGSRWYRIVIAFELFSGLSGCSLGERIGDHLGRMDVWLYTPLVDEREGGPWEWDLERLLFPLASTMVSEVRIIVLATVPTWVMRTTTPDQLWTENPGRLFIDVQTKVVTEWEILFYSAYVSMMVIYNITPGCHAGMIVHGRTRNEKISCRLIAVIRHDSLVSLYHPVKRAMFHIANEFQETMPFWLVGKQRHKN